MLLRTLDVSLLGNLLTGKGSIRAGEQILKYKILSKQT